MEYIKIKVLLIVVTYTKLRPIDRLDSGIGGLHRGAMALQLELVSLLLPVWFIAPNFNKLQDEQIVLSLCVLPGIVLIRNMHCIHSSNIIRYIPNVLKH